MGFERMHGNGNGNGLIYDHGGLEERENIGGENSPRMASLKVFPVSSSSATSASSSSSCSPRRYIEHHVTKLDTLAGVAIRYGVEVADIKRLNGLVTDLQMFALKTLHIPLPGRHPPSPCLSNGHSTSGQSRSEQAPPRRTRTDLLESFQSLRVTPDRNVSPAMNSLLGYYGLNGGKNPSEGCEMALYSKGRSSSNYQPDEGFTTPSLMNPPLTHNRRSRSLANGFELDPSDDVGTDFGKWIDKLSRRRQKSEADFTRTPEKVLKEENSSGGWFSAIAGKGLALRSKAASRTNLASEGEGGINGFPPLPGDSAASENSSAVRKSSSTSSLQEQENNSTTTSSIWSSLKPEIQAALGKPLFDGLSKPGRKAKAALD